MPVGTDDLRILRTDAIRRLEAVLFDDRSLAGLLILELHVIDESGSSPRIGLESMRSAPGDEPIGVEIHTKYTIAAGLDEIALLLDYGFPFFKTDGHVLGILKDRQRPAVSNLIFEPRNSDNIAHPAVSSLLLCAVPVGAPILTAATTSLCPMSSSFIILTGEEQLKIADEVTCIPLDSRSQTFKVAKVEVSG
jgi:hypothetical protein